MGVTLYTSRIVLSALGYDDYGLYSLIGGFVALFGILSGSLSGAISRFITFELGKGNQVRLNKVFSCSVFIQFTICMVIICLSLTIGIWFIANKMVIPNEDYISAYWVFGVSILSFCLSLLSVPYNAALIAHEKMAVFSYVSVIEVVLKLAVAYSIYLFRSNRLIAYALMLFAVSAIIQVIYMLYCRKSFDECRSSWKYDSTIFKEIGKFAGWNFIGAASSVLRNQGNNVILNLFYGTVVNAAYAISMQVNNAVNQLSDNFMVAVNPQITKLYANGEICEMNKLVARSSRMSFFLCWILSLVIFINTPYILELWLKNVPEYTSTMVNLVLLLLLSESISKPLITAMLATGNIRNYQIIVGGLQMLNLPISYFVLKMGFPPPCVLLIAVVISQICFIARIFMLIRMIKLNIVIYLKDVYLRCLLVAFVSALIPMAINLHIPALSISWFIIESIVCVISSVFCVYFLGMNRHERESLLKYFSAMKYKLHIS